jgi:hypothetical protein
MTGFFFMKQIKIYTMLENIDRICIDIYNLNFRKKIFTMEDFSNLKVFKHPAIHAIDRISLCVKN